MLQALCLVALLIAGQQGALVHQLGHLSGIQDTSIGAQPEHATEPVCALCPSFAQAASPTFAHSFNVPALLPAGVDRTPAQPINSADAALPTARSRGPPR